MSLMDRLAPAAPAFPLAAPRCARCFELIHLTVFSTAHTGPYYHAACTPGAERS